MKASVFYRIAAILLLLFAAARTVGFSQSDPRWGVGALLASMRSIHFDAMGSSRSYWDFFMASGLTVGAHYLFASVLAWQLAGLSAETRVALRATLWGFALCFVAVAILCWLYLFLVPILFATTIALCLTAAAWLSSSRPAAP